MAVKSQCAFLLKCQLRQSLVISKREILYSIINNNVDGTYKDIILNPSTMTDQRGNIYCSTIKYCCGIVKSLSS